MGEWGGSQEGCPEDTPCPVQRRLIPLPVPPPPWLALSAGKMPEHLSHSTWPAKHSSVMMCSAFWHRLLTPSSLRKLILASVCCSFDFPWPEAEP